MAKPLLRVFVLRSLRRASLDSRVATKEALARTSQDAWYYAPMAVGVLSMHNTETTVNVYLSDLSFANRRLVDLLSEINFGRILELRFASGEPVYDPPPRYQRDYRLSGACEPPPPKPKSDFQLRQPVVRLLAAIVARGDGRIVNLEVRHGMPITMTEEDWLR